MMGSGVVSVLILALSTMLVEKLDAFSLQSLNCPANQVKGCPPCSDGTCDSLKHPVHLFCLDQICIPSCVCKKDYYLQNNECVHVSQCDVQCPENMEFNFCVKKTFLCATLHSEVKEHDCKPQCQCKEGYVFSGLKPQDCIKISECPKNEPNTV